MAIVQIVVGMCGGFIREFIRGEITSRIGALHDMTYGSFCYQRVHQNA